MPHGCKRTVYSARKKSGCLSRFDRSVSFPCRTSNFEWPAQHKEGPKYDKTKCRAQAQSIQFAVGRMASAPAIVKPPHMLLHTTHQREHVHATCTWAKELPCQDDYAATVQKALLHFGLGPTAALAAYSIPRCCECPLQLVKM
eukprot:2974006-Amphidinium_carterae.1